MASWDKTQEISFSCQGYDSVSIKLAKPFIALDELQRYFPNAVGLSYSLNRKTFCMICENDGFNLERNVYHYEIRCTSAPSKKINFNEKKKTEYNNILAIIKGANVDMKEELKKESTPKVAEQHKTRSLILVHKHRDSPTEIPYKLKPKDEKQLTLNANGMYSVDEIIRMGVPLFKYELNHLYFEKCSINLTTASGMIIDEFKISDKFVGLWKYLAPISDRTHRSILCLLTTYTAPSNKFHSLADQISFEKNLSKRTMSEVNNKENASENKKKKVSFEKLPESLKELELPEVKLCSEKNSLKFSCVSQSKNHKNADEDPNKKNVLTESSLEESSAVPVKVQMKNDKKVSKEKSNDSSAFIKPKSPLRLEDINDIKMNLISLIPKEQLEFGKELGRGTFGVVKEGKCNGTPVAIKSIFSFSASNKAILKEISALRHINHVNIVSIMGASASYVQFHIVMELVRGNSLRSIIFDDAIKKQYKLTLSNRHSIGKQLCTGISWMHLHPLKVIHRDIKPDNVLVQKTDKNVLVKICDLGLAKIYNQCSQLMTTQGKSRSIGTPFYMAPEILLHRQEGTVYSDVWAVAGTIVELYSEKPFWKLEEPEDLEIFMEKKMKPSCDRVPQFLRSIIQLAFEYCPENRPQCIKIKEKFDEKI